METEPQRDAADRAGRRIPALDLSTDLLPHGDRSPRVYAVGDEITCQR